MHHQFPIIGPSRLLETFHNARRNNPAELLAMYSSYVGGILTDPALMFVPVDDHLVHRGDGVFETMKCVRGSVYNLDAHLTRLLNSAERIGLSSPFSRGHLRAAVLETARAAARPDCAIRLLLSRGPGGLGVNPYECTHAQLYVIAAPLPPPFMETHPAGASAIISSIPAKSSLLAQAKTCNYLSNVLMKKEAADAGADFALALDNKGRLSEGATESAMVVTSDGSLCLPSSRQLLPGTTAERLVALLQETTPPVPIQRRALPRDTLYSAREIILVGTTIDVVAVTRLNDRPVGTGQPGPVYESLSALLREDLIHGKTALTPFL